MGILFGFVQGKYETHTYLELQPVLRKYLYHVYIIQKEKCPCVELVEHFSMEKYGRVEL
jgi:hypothetical protein